MYCPGNEKDYNIFFSPVSKQIKNECGNLCYRNFYVLKKPISKKVLNSYFEKYNLTKPINKFEKFFENEIL